MFSHRFFDRPVRTVNTIVQCTTVDSETFRPLHYIERFALISNIALPSAIVCLLRPCRPATIARKISQIIIASIKASSLRARAHVAKECLKAIFPFIAHCYAARAIPVIGVVIWIKTSLLGVLPRVVFARVAPTVSRQAADATFQIPFETVRFHCVRKLSKVAF